MALKSDNTKRPCGAYVHMNDATVDNQIFIPSVNDTLDKLKPNHKIFFTADVEAAFNSVRVTESPSRQLALWMPDGCVFFPFVMPYGAKNALPAFAHNIALALRQVLGARGDQLLQ